jgi:hypothetical protein
MVNARVSLFVKCKRFGLGRRPSCGSSAKGNPYLVR